MTDENLLKKVSAAVGRPAATALVVEDTDERHFITEATLLAAALYVLKKYVDGFLKGLGVEQLGQEHGELAIRTIRDAREAVAADPAVVAGKVVALVQALRTKVSATARLQAEMEVQHELVEHGLPTEEAAAISARVSAVCDLDD